MPAIPQVTQGGPRSYVPAAGQTVAAGTFVEGTTGGRIRTAVAGSTRALGVALQDAAAPEQLVTTAALNGGRPVLNMVTPAQNVAVAYGGVEVNCVFSAAAQFGDRLVITAGGQVAPAGATPDQRTVVGICTSPSGVAGAAQVGLVRVTI